MIGFFAKRKKEREDKRVRDELISRLSGKIIKYVTERTPDGSTDTIIGKEGSLTVRDGELIVLSSSNIVFRCKVEALLASELLSLEGVILEGEDLEHGCAQRKIIAYYKYYR